MSNCGMIYGSLGMVEVVHVASSTVAYRPTLTHSLSTTFTARSKYVLKQMSMVWLWGSWMSFLCMPSGTANPMSGCFGFVIKVWGVV